MEFKELLVAFAANYDIEGFGDVDGVAELEVAFKRIFPCVTFSRPACIQG